MPTTRPKLSLLRHVFLVALASAPLACKDGGCGGGGAAAPADASESATTSPSASAAVGASSSAGAGRPRWSSVRASGPVGALFRAVNSIELTEEQKTKLDEIAADMREAERAARDTAEAGAPRAEMREAHAALIAGVKAGKIEAAKMEPHYAALEKTAKAREDREADALDRLHATLTPAQRSAVVGSVRSSEGIIAARMKLHERPDAGARSFARVRIERYTRDLGLDAAQQKKVEAILPQEDRAASTREEAKKHTEALLAAFDQESFDAKKLDLGQAKLARAPIEEQVKLFGQLLPILKPEQRERLAQSLERTSEQARPHRGMGTGERVHGDHGHDDDVH